MTTLTRTRLAVLLAIAFSGPLAVHAAVDAQDWNRNLQVMDYYTTPPEGGDADFFTSVAPKGVIALAYATRNTLNGLPTSLYEMRAGFGDPTPTGCQNNFLNTLNYFISGTEAPALQGTYNNAYNYPDPEPAYTSVVTVSDGIAPASYYNYGQWPAGPGGASTAQTATNACQSATGSVVSANYLACVACLTASNAGYWLNPSVNNNDTTPQAGVFKGNFLRFYPPKWVLLKLAYKRLLNSSLLSTVREGVAVFNGAAGGTIAQKLLPQSCNGQGAQNGQGILKQKLGVLDGIVNTSTANPLAEMLFNIGYYFSGASSTWAPSGYFTTSKAIPGSFDSSGAPCANNPCGQEFVLLFSDGRGDQGNPNCRGGNVGNNGPCKTDNVCGTVGMGTEQDGDDFLDPSFGGNIDTLVTGASVHTTASGTCSHDYLTDVAGWINNNPMLPSFAGRSNVVTYIVGIGSNTYGAMNTLKAAADAGGGRFVLASDFQTLENQVKQVLLEIIKRTTSFSVAAITTVQTRGSTFAFIPRFKPLAGNDWNGRLFRFKLFNEFSAGCTAVDYGKANDYLNPNRDSSCNNIYLTDADGVDATATPTIPSANFFNSFVGEDSQGNFVKLDTTQPYVVGTGWPIKSPTVAANPVWEASAKLTNRINGVNGVPGYNASAPARTIWTMYDASGTGTYDTRVSLDTTPANLTILAPLLALGGVTGTFCTELSGYTRNTYAAETDCAADVVKFLQGQDVLFQNTANTPGITPYQARPNILGDIFHSSPILMTPPAPQFLCDLGVATQCVFSLYATGLTPGGSTAYPTYSANKSTRDQVIVVGANDGMLHAFRAGVMRNGDDPETPAVESGSNTHYDLGDGFELWAFVPPDMLPKLKLYVLGGRHEQFVDGTPMIRDIWVDGSGSSSADHVKQADEFHTIAVVGEREGGRHWFALDLTDPYNPTYKWQWPLPGTADDIAVGESWNDHAPAPAPIGPIAVYDAAGPLTINGTKASERYVVALGGGWDPNLVRGRGVYIVDAWTGSVMWRYTATDSGAGSDARQYLYPVAATVSLVDTNNDGLFDTAVVGDTMGQVWTFGMLSPGGRSGGAGTPFDNWFGGRAFVTAKGQPLYNRTPFFQLASVAQLPSGDIRAYLGGGDRFHIKDSSVTSCGLDNLEGCIRRGCTIDSNAQQVQSGTHYDNGEWSYTPATAIDPTTNTAPNSDGVNTPSSTATDTDNVTLKTVLNCNGTSVSYANLLSCDWGASNPGIDCSVKSGKPQLTQLDNNLISCTSPFVGPSQPCFTPAVTANEQKGRFYSIKLFDTANRKVMTSAALASTYDANRLTDQAGANDLVNADTTPASGTGNGWYVNFNDWTEKTTSGGLILAGCVAWNTVLPTTAALTCGSTPPADTANLYQADPITGAISCGISGSATALAVARYTSRTAVVPPPMPTPVVSLNPTSGQVAYTGVSLEPGNNVPLQISMGGGDILGLIHWLEITRKLHNCRHGNAGVVSDCGQ
jgi:type IV pilus assembly protein PilY1